MSYDCRQPSVMSVKDLMLLVTMPLWLPLILLAGTFLPLFIVPPLLFGPMILLKTGSLSAVPGVGPAATALAILAAPGLVAYGFKKLIEHEKKEPRNRLECPRCGNLDPNNVRGGVFTCTICGLT